MRSYTLFRTKGQKPYPVQRHIKVWAMSGITIPGTKPGNRGRIGVFSQKETVLALQNGVSTSLTSSSKTQGQIVGARESLNGWKNMARRKVKNGEKSPWGQCLTRPVPNGRCRSAF